jgi:transposase
MTHGVRPPTKWRPLAIKCWYESRGVMVDAVKAFRAATGAKCMARPQRFIAKWAGAMERSGRLDDAARSGRPQKLNDDQALDAAESFCGGFQQKGSSTTLHNLFI